VLHYAHIDPGRQTMAEARLKVLFLRFGWQEIGTVALTVDGSYRTTVWKGSACPGSIEIGAFSSDGEAAGLIGERVDPDRKLFYVHAGQISADLPPFAFLYDKFTVAMEAAGIPGFHASPYVAVIEPKACRLEDALPWHQL
jgi:hypothetical protein